MKIFAFAAGAAFLAALAWIAAGTTPNVATPPPLVHSEPRTKSVASPTPNPGDAPRPLMMPVSGIDPSTIHDTFNDMRGGGTRRHEALDILTPRGTPIVATDDGTVRKLFTSVAGGLTVYEFDPDQRYCYYYTHLDGYAPDLHEGQLLRRGDLVGYAGTTGDAAADTPHLHFAVIRLDADKRWWTGTPIDPYPLLYKAR